MPRSTRSGLARSGLDRVAEHLSRRLASTTSRRGLIARLSAVLVAAPAIPLLPIARARAADAPLTDFAANAQTNDQGACTYWRYCALDGALCTLCGGGIHTCPPGTQSSPTSWIGTCYNPTDRAHYLIAYRDCCGQDACSQKSCLGMDGDLPSYRPQSNNDIIWCYGASSLLYHCSTAVVIGPAG